MSANWCRHKMQPRRKPGCQPIDVVIRCSREENQDVCQSMSSQDVAEKKTKMSHCFIWLAFVDIYKYIGLKTGISVWIYTNFHQYWIRYLSNPLILFRIKWILFGFRFIQNAQRNDLDSKIIDSIHHWYDP